MTVSDWHDFFINMTHLVASKSKDRSTQVGAVIIGDDNEVLSVGYNGFPRGVDDNVEFRHERPLKYEFTEHAERNAIYNAARQGIRLKGSVMYLSWEPYPCPDCARAVVQAGIKEVRGPNRPFPNTGGTVDWHERFKHSREILAEGGVKVTTIGELNE